MFTADRIHSPDSGFFFRIQVTIRPQFDIMDVDIDLLIERGIRFPGGYQKKMKNAKKLRRKLDYLPSWAWYVLSLCIAGPVGPVVVYLLFYALDKAVKEENESERNGTDWNVDIDRNGVHVRGRSRNRGNAYADEDCTVTDDDDINRRWTQTEASAEHARREAAENAQPAPEAGDTDDVAAVIREGRDAMRRIRRANDLIPDPELSAQIDSIENSCGQILSFWSSVPSCSASCAHSCAIICPRPCAFWKRAPSWKTARTRRKPARFAVESLSP